jgi:hypothetical protein
LLEETVLADLVITVFGAAAPAIAAGLKTRLARTLPEAREIKTSRIDGTKLFIYYSAFDFLALSLLTTIAGATMTSNKRIAAINISVWFKPQVCFGIS